MLAAIAPLILFAAQTVYARGATKAHHHKHPKHASGKATPSRRSAANSTARRSSDPGVTIADFLFSPGTITIHVGDTIVWSNNGPSSHTATANNGSFDTGVLAKGKSASVTFHTPGTFAYHCTIHPFMHGAVVVQAASTTPSTTKTTPSPSSPSSPSSSGPPSSNSNSQTSSSGTTSPGTAPTSTSSGPTLPMTGTNVIALVLTGVLLLGAGLILRRRLRQS